VEQHLQDVGPIAGNVIERDRATLSPSYTRVYPLVIDRAQGSEVWDVDGRRYLDFMAGIAIKRASQLTGHTFAGKNTTIIGDTPADILCARAAAATAVAVASGWHAATTLVQYKPDYLLII
jgi:4-aminobutyrate aminotransferase-like enzyme